jgi:hypothetical protein
MTRITPLLKFNFPFQEKNVKVPTIPVRFIDAAGHTTPIIHAILDSGADNITIPKDLADFLQLPLKLLPEQVSTAAGLVNSYSSNVPFFILGQGGREVQYQDEQIRIIETCRAILIGIDPIFLEYAISINARDQKIFLDPLTPIK